MDRWESEADAYDRAPGRPEVRRDGRKRELTQAGIWAHFDELGDDGREPASAGRIAAARRANPERSTTRMIFAFERRKATRLRRARNIAAECAAIQSPTARQPRGEPIPAPCRSELRRTRATEPTFD